MFRLLPLAALLGLAAAGRADEPARFARHPDIAPDGTTVVFSYLGDLYAVDSAGGTARPITSHEAHDAAPCFSPDGKQIAFASNRHGSYDVFVVAAQGGKPRRLTWDSAADLPCGWTPDGKGVLFSSDRSPDYPKSGGVYVVPAEGGQERPLPLFEAKEAVVRPAGDLAAFVRGPGAAYRRGYRGSSNDDLWVSRLDGTQPRRLTTFNGQDASPQWSPDGKRLFYVTEEGSQPGCANVVVRDLDGPEKPPQIVTRHADDGVRRMRLSRDGGTLVYECGGDLYVAPAAGGEPRKLSIIVNADDKSNTEKTTTHKAGASEFALSPDEGHAVIVVHGELFLARVGGAAGKAVRLTDHPAMDQNPAWSPDGKKLLFLSDRTGVQELFVLESDDAESAEIAKARQFKVTQLTHGRAEESRAAFTPKGDRVSFLRDGLLWTMKPDGTEQKVLIGEPRVVDYEWSPDGKWVAYSRLDGNFASEIYLAPADGSEGARNVTRYATSNSQITWSRTGGKLAFVSNRRKEDGVYVLSLAKPASSGFSTRLKGAPPAGEIDWDDIHLRAVRAAPLPALTAAVSPDGNLVAFRSTSAGQSDLWVASSEGTGVQRVTSGGGGATGLRWSRKTAGVVYFLNNLGELRFARAGGSPAATLAGLIGGATAPAPALGAPAEPGRVPFSATLTVQQGEQFAEMFTQCWRAIAEQFYDQKYHGANWVAVRDKYEPLVRHVVLKEDFYALISLMVGELNASHLGISGPQRAPEEQTADLGLLFDNAFEGPGLKIREVVARGPADRRGLGLAPGDVIVGIDRTELTGKSNLSRLLANKAGEPVALEVTRTPSDANSRRKVEVVAADRAKVGQLLYDRWVARNAEAVANASSGRLGYVHIPSMDDDGLELFMRALYSDNFDKEALLIDVRYNGGGFTHDQVLNYLSGKQHTVFRQRNGGEGWVMRNFDRKWARPAAVLINNRSYSDAEIFPHAFRESGFGKLVGQATGGLVIGTGQTTLIDGSRFRLPRIGVYTVRGINMDKEGVAPDVAAEPDAADWARGIDTQLLKGVEVLEEELEAWKRSRGLIGSAPPPRVLKAEPAASRE